ncbi:hypothetical protein EJB05_53968, partial [Eragrostis curvula]
MRLTWACSEAAETAWPHTSNIFKFVVAKASTHSKLLAKLFCDAIRLQRPCTIILETSTNNTGWQVSGYPCKDGSYVLRRGWRSFCRLNNLKEDDTCTFHVLKPTHWDVVVTLAFAVTAKKKKKKKERDFYRSYGREFLMMREVSCAAPEENSTGPDGTRKWNPGDSIREQLTSHDQDAADSPLVECWQTRFQCYPKHSSFQSPAHVSSPMAPCGDSGASKASNLRLLRHPTLGNFP